MNAKNDKKLAFGVLLAMLSLPVLGFSFGIWPRGVIVIGLIMLIAGIVLIVMGLKKRPELKENPTEVVIDGVHYPKSAFAGVDRCVQGRETIFAIKELQRVTGISPERAREVVNNWKQYYRK